MQQLTGEENELSTFLKCHGLPLRLAEYHYSVKSIKYFLFFLHSAAAWATLNWKITLWGHSICFLCTILDELIMWWKKITDFFSNKTLTADDDGKKVKFNRQSSYSDDFSLEGRGFHLLDPLLSKGRDG